MESDGDTEQETVIISGDYDEEFDNRLQGTQLTVVHAQEIIGSVSHAGHEIANITNVNSGTKNKYYKQTYRPAWENMPDFKGWLRAVPGEATRAFCIYCQKTLHAHRLSLLKHTCTMRHQKAAQIHQARKMNQQNTFEVLVQSTTADSESTEEQQSNDQTMDEETFLSEENEELEQDPDEEGDDEPTTMRKDEIQKNNQYLKQLNMASTSPISTHVLDTTKGQPVQGLQVSLYKLIEGRWTYINEVHTNVDGHSWNFLERKDFSTGRYKLHYDVDRYFEAKKLDTIFPFIEIIFDARAVTDRFNIPLLLSPFGYTTYRG